jgi:hypothetical protein
VTPPAGKLVITSGELRSRGPVSRQSLVVIPLSLLVAVVIFQLVGERGGPYAWVARAIAVQGFIIISIGAIGSRMMPGRRGARTGRVEVGAPGVMLDGAIFLRRRVIEAGDMVLFPDDALAVRLTVRGWSPAVHVVVRDEAEGNAVLRSLGLLGTTSRVTFETGGPFWGWGRVTVGSDGVLLVDSLGRRRLLRHGLIDEMECDGVELVLRAEGRTERFRVRGRVTDKTGGYSRAAIRRRIAEARAAGLRGGASNASLADDPVLLAATSANEEGGYRSPAASRDALWALIEDPAAPPGARARSATALRASGEEVTRLRAAAQAIAEPTLRDALESAATSAEDATDSARAPTRSPPRSGAAS